MLQTVLEFKSKVKLNQALLSIFIPLLIVFYGMRFFDAPLKNAVSPNGIVSFELAKELNTSIAIIESWGPHERASAGMSMGLDFLFLILYSIFLALLIYKFRGTEKRSFAFKTGKLLIGAVFLAAFFDVIENIALIRLLLGDLQQFWSTIAYYMALVKFGIILIGLFYLLTRSLLLVLKRKP